MVRLNSPQRFAASRGASQGWKDTVSLARLITTATDYNRDQQRAFYAACGHHVLSSFCQLGMKDFSGGNSDTIFNLEYMLVSIAERDRSSERLWRGAAWSFSWRLQPPCCFMGEICNSVRRSDLHCPDAIAAAACPSPPKLPPPPVRRPSISATPPACSAVCGTAAPSILVVGSLNVDITVPVHRLPERGETITARDPATSIAVGESSRLGHSYASSACQSRLECILSQKNHF